MNKKNQYISQLNKVLEKYQPSAVYLYGSYAYGKPTADSDLDLLVITERASKELHKKIMSDLWDFEIPIELVVYSQHAIREKIAWNLLVQHILRKGELIYGQAVS